jgi:hypothetical protein
MPTPSPEFETAVHDFRCPNGHFGSLEFIKGVGPLVKYPTSKLAVSEIPRQAVFGYVNLYKMVTGSGLKYWRLRTDSLLKCNKCGGTWPVFSDASSVAIVSSVNTRRIATPIGFDDYVRDNLGSSIPMTSTIKISRRWLQRLEIDWERTTTMGNAVKAGLPAKYGGVGIESKIEQSLKSALSLSTETEQLMEQGIEVVVPAHSRVIVRLNWKQIWQEGEMEIRLPDEALAKIPYRVSVDIAFDQENIEG